MIRKIIRSLRRDGLLSTLKKVYRTIKYGKKFRSIENVRRFLNEEIDTLKFSTIIIFENNFGWNKIMKQRPQHIAENLPDDALMFYHSHEDIDFPKGMRVNKLKDNLVLIDLGYFRDILLERLALHCNKFVMVYSTDYIPYERLELYRDYNYSILYEYVDDINEDLSGEEMYKILGERHENILSDEAYVVCTSTKLYDNIKDIKKNSCTLITNGVNYDHFRYKEYDVPDDLKGIKSKYKHLICYYGALASWFDYGIIDRIAERKDSGIVLIGQDYDQTLEKSGILENDNVFYLGKKQYDELPAYGCNVDVFIIPFLVNDITLATSPVKVFEYMAMEKPIVTTALPECKKYESVLYSENAEAFISNIDKALELADNAEYKKLLKKEAKENTWAMKSENMVKFINSAKYKTIYDTISDILEEEQYKRIVVWRSPFGWNVPLFQRPQHISRQLARQDCLVLYEITMNTDIVPTIRRQEKNLYLVNFNNYLLNQILFRILSEVDTPKYLQIYSTNWSMSVDEMKEYTDAGFKVIYEYIDDISPDLSGTEEIPQYVLDKYNYAMEHEDVAMVTTAKEIYNDVVEKRGKNNMVFSCNGVDYDFFQQIDDDFEFEADFLKVINNGKINVCYYGALANWFDYELIRRIDSTNKYNIILFGIRYDASLDNSGICQLKNVHFFGAKDYSVLKNYASKMDVLTIPFLINSITQATSPLKLFEYMALHKPIVTTAMNECKNYASVLIAGDHDEFIACLDRCAALAGDKDYLALLDKEAKENDWSAKAQTIVELIEENEAKQGKRS